MNVNELENLGLNLEEIERVDELDSFLEGVNEAEDEDVLPPNSIVIAPEQTLRLEGEGDEATLTIPEEVITEPIVEISVNQISGTSGDDDIIGTDFADEISALGGNDRVSGRLGDDTIGGNSGDDDLAGQGGSDQLFGGNGADLIFGDSRFSDDPSDNFFGNDSISGGGDRDIVFGILGDDTITGGNGNDVLSGGDGNDSVRGGRDNDTVTGGEGDDILKGNAGDDAIFGEDDNDSLDGGSGDDLIYGDRRDSSSNAIGNDTLKGNGGNDTLIGGANSDSLDGGSGSDRLIGVEDFQIQFDAGADTRDTLTGGADNDIFVLGGENENGEEQVFYDDGNPFEQGTDDFALITDFTFGDRLEVVGSVNDYTLASSPEGTPDGTAVFSQRGENSELIAILENFSIFQPNTGRTAESNGQLVSPSIFPDSSSEIAPTDIFTSIS